MIDDKPQNLVQFKFALHQAVLIVPLKLEGVIFARCDRGDGIHDYRVVFWADGKRHDDWLYGYELTHCK
jgi:hypothetical protein